MDRYTRGHGHQGYGGHDGYNVPGILYTGQLEQNYYPQYGWGYSYNPYYHHHHHHHHHHYNYQW